MSLILIWTLRLTPLAATAFSHRAPTLHRSLARSLLPRCHVPHLRRSLLAPLPCPSRTPPAPCSSLWPCVALPAPSCSARYLLGWAKADVASVGWWLCSSAAARCRIPPWWPELTSPSLSLSYITNVWSISVILEVCYNCYIWMLQK
jgi:hypothetical protein